MITQKVSSRLTSQEVHSTSHKNIQTNKQTTKTKTNICQENKQQTNKKLSNKKLSNKTKNTESQKHQTNAAAAAATCLETPLGSSGAVRRTGQLGENVQGEGVFGGSEMFVCLLVCLFAFFFYYFFLCFFFLCCLSFCFLFLIEMVLRC